jgi:hypothetical protein
VPHGLRQAAVKDKTGAMGAGLHRGRVALALLALALQLALPLWHMPAGATVLICTAQGLKPVPADPGGAPAPKKPHEACPICQTAQAGAGGLPLPAQSVIAMIEADGSGVALEPVPAPAPRRFTVAAPRGPPLRA